MFVYGADRTGDRSKTERHKQKQKHRTLVCDTARIGLIGDRETQTGHEQGTNRVCAKMFY